MKDEEMAEEIVKRNVCGDCNKCQSHGYIGCDIYRYSKDSFLAGLKAGRPQWHKVADGDLPKESGRYLVYVGGGENGVYPLDFDTEANDFGYWCLQVGASLGVTDTIFETVTERNEDKVIAWKEIVLPKESE